MPANSQETEIHWPEELSAADREELRDFLLAYDSAAAEFSDDHKVIFPSEQERKRLYYGFVKRWSKAWSRRGLCMYAGCTKHSILRSHTISLGSSIRLIAEDDHVLQPKFKEGVVELESVGVNEASTFPGFCDEHEALFADFETQKTMTADEHFKLQTFRGICREIYAQKHQRLKAEGMLADYRRLRGEFFITRVKPTYRGDSPLTATSVQFENDPIENTLTSTLAGISYDLAELDILYRIVLDDLRDVKGGDRGAIAILAIDEQLPVCLSGIGVLNYSDNSQRKRALCILSIIPEQGKTHLLWFSKQEHKKALEGLFIDRSLPAILERLESWMVNGTDHWFIAPSAWALIPRKRQRVICQHILREFSIADNAPFSIFDAARRQYIKLIKRALAGGTVARANIPATKQLLARERKKLLFP